MTTSRSDAPASEFDRFVRSGEWTETETDREGLRCASQTRDTIAGPATMRAYFAPADGRLKNLSVEVAGQVSEFAPEAVAMMAARAVQEKEAEIDAAAPRSRTLGHGRFSTRR